MPQKYRIRTSEISRKGVIKEKIGMTLFYLAILITTAIHYESPLVSGRQLEMLKTLSWEPFLTTE